MKINSELFSAFLECPYQAILLSQGKVRAEPPEASKIRERLRELRKEEWLRENQAQPAPDGAIHALSDGTWRGVRLSWEGFECQVDAIRVRGHERIVIRIGDGARATEKDRLSLAYSAFVLAKQTGSPAASGELVTSDGSGVRVPLPSLSRKLATSLRKLAALLSDPGEEHFLLNRHCESCRYSAHCRKKALETDHLSLLAGMSAREIRRQNQKGIFTVTQLSHTFRPRRPARGVKAAIRNQPALRALALREKKTHVLHRPELPQSDTFAYLDVEGLPDRDFVYLAGLLVVRGAARVFHQFWADSPEEEKRIWLDLAGVLNGLRDFVLVHHGKYDALYLKKMQERHSGLRIDGWPGPLLNTLSLIYGKVYFPAYGNGLKEIARSLGFRWTDADASGLASIAWRLEWEYSRRSSLKQRLLTYNREDCEALSVVLAQLRELASDGNPGSAVLCEKMKRAHPYGWGRNTFAFPELEFVNRRAYFDYQQEKIYWRTAERGQDAQATRYKESSPRKRGKRAASNLRALPVDEVRISARPENCPSCGGPDVIKHQKAPRVVYDLQFTGSGVRRWIIRYDNHRFSCRRCGKRCYSPEHPEPSKYGHSLLAWAVYHGIGLRQSQENVASGLNEIFGFRHPWSSVLPRLKERAARFYRPAYEDLLRNLRSGPLVHVDETHVSVKGVRNYVWAFTNLDEVAYVFAETREGGVVRDVLRGFQGVMVSDFYPAYEGMECRQQRCLIHLIRDLNDDLFSHQLDAEYRSLVRGFAELVKPIIVTIDRHGLKREFLSRHREAVERFYRERVEPESSSELIRAYQARFRKNQEWLFTFLDHDGVPWNNNNAENAIKGFATLRKAIGGTSTEKGLRDSLVLLSLCQTLRNKKASSLGFFRSGLVSLEDYFEMEGTPSGPA